MTELERALLHIKTRADAWAVREVEQALSQQPCDDVVSRDAAIEAVKQAIYNHDSAIMRLTELPPVTQKTGHCKECKYFEYDSVAKVDGIPLIVAHEICNKWGNGCKTSEDGYCYLFEPQERSDKE